MFLLGLVALLARDSQVPNWLLNNEFNEMYLLSSLNSNDSKTCFVFLLRFLSHLMRICYLKLNFCVNNI